MNEINKGDFSKDVNKECSLAVTSFIFNTLITIPLTNVTETILIIENIIIVKIDCFKFLRNFKAYSFKSL